MAAMDGSLDLWRSVPPATTLTRGPNVLPGDDSAGDATIHSGPFNFGTLQNRPLLWIDMLTAHSE